MIDGPMSENPSQPSAIVVRHNAAASRFEALVDGHLAVADYALQENRMIFTHTFVPPELRGRGIAEKLVRPALEWARAEQRVVVPACSYVAAFIERHREFHALLG
jgi:predicted GNAT family acetyltransferase